MALISNSKKTCGELLAKILTGAWRATPPHLEISEAQLAVVVQPLLTTGAGALAWWRIAQSSPQSEARNFAIADELHQAYRLHTLHSAINEKRIKRILAAFNQRAVPNLIFKGWVNAITYPETALRPFGDVDLLVSESDYPKAQALLRELGGDGFTVDLHEEGGKRYERDFATFYNRSRSIPIGEMTALTMSAEDHLRLLCFHFFKHGAWRPIWLCDIAAAIESRPADFDWTYFLGTDERRKTWVTCAVGLAHLLLDAKIHDTPLADAAGRIPRWLISGVLDAWSRQTSSNRLVPPKIVWDVRHPSTTIKLIGRRWAGPIEASYSLGSAFNNMPRLPFQVMRFAQQSWYYLKYPNDVAARGRALRYF